MDVLSDFQAPNPTKKPKTKLGTTGAGKGFSKYIGDDEIGRLVSLLSSCYQLQTACFISAMINQLLSGLISHYSLLNAN